MLEIFIFWNFKWDLHISYIIYIYTWVWPFTLLEIDGNPIVGNCLQGKCSVVYLLFLHQTTNTLPSVGQWVAAAASYLWIVALQYWGLPPQLCRAHHSFVFVRYLRKALFNCFRMHVTGKSLCPLKWWYIQLCSLQTGRLDFKLTESKSGKQLPFVHETPCVRDKTR